MNHSGILLLSHIIIASILRLSTEQPEPILKVLAMISYLKFHFVYTLAHIFTYLETPPMD